MYLIKNAKNKTKNHIPKKSKLLKGLDFQTLSTFNKVDSILKELPCFSLISFRGERMERSEVRGEQ